MNKRHPRFSSQPRHLLHIVVIINSKRYPEAGEQHLSLFFCCCCLLFIPPVHHVMIVHMFSVIGSLLLEGCYRSIDRSRVPASYRLLVVQSPMFICSYLLRDYIDVQRRLALSVDCYSWYSLILGASCITCDRATDSR